MAKDFDAILKRVGGFGRYQVQMMFLVVLPTAFFVAMQLSTKIFQTVVPDHWCSVPGREKTQYTEEQWKNITIPRSADGAAYSQCRAYSIDWQDGAPKATNSTYKCRSWEYDQSLMQETLATSFDWVCGKELYSAHILSIMAIGNGIGTLVLPLIADRYTGRRPMFFFAVALDFVFTLAALFLPTFTGQMAVRFISSLAFQTNYQMSYLITMEFLSPEYRAFIAGLSFFSWSLGMCAVAVLAWALTSWRYLLGLVLLADVYMFSLWFCLPESPRWLLSQHRMDEAVKTLVKVSQVNRTSDQIQEKEILSELSTIEDDNLEKESFLTAMKYPKFRIRILLIMIMSISGSLGYGILVYDIDVLPNRYFMNFFILSIVELPGTASGWFCSQYFGRRFTGITSNAATTILSMAAICLTDQKFALLILVGVIKCTSVMAQYVMDLMVLEVYPTTLRSTGMGFIKVSAATAMTLVPYIINSGLGVTFTYYVILAVSILALLCMLLLPETLELPLPQTLPEAESVGSTRPLYKWVHYWNHHKYKPIPFSDLKQQRQDKRENLETRHDQELEIIL